MFKTKSLFLIVAIFFLNSCATTYGEKDVFWGGGYTDKKIEKGIYEIEFIGSGNMAIEKVKAYCLHRAAELTLKNGANYFIVIGAANFSSSFVVFTKTTIPKFRLKIKTFKGPFPGKNPSAFEAEKLLALLEPEINKKIDLFGAVPEIKSTLLTVDLPPIIVDQQLAANPNGDASSENIKTAKQPEPIAPPIIRSKPKTKPPGAQVPAAEPQQPSKTFQHAYAGTGFMFSSKDYVITNWHVVRGAKKINVKFLNGEEINGKVLLKDTQNDVAFLKLERSPELPSSDFRLGNSSKVRMGDKVFTIGYPAYWVMGQNPKYTEGVVNAVSGIKDDPTVFQISVPIQPGNSGGPLFNQKGEVIGITQASLDSSLASEALGTIPQNVNYAIKSSFISNLLPLLPETLLASRGIVVVPTQPEYTLANFIDRAKKNIVLIKSTAR